MNWKACSFVAFVFMSPGFVTGASAMKIHDFGRLNNDDEAGFVAMLVQGAADNLKAQGKPDQAAKVLAFFHTPGKGGGVYTFADNLKQADAQNKLSQTNPNNRNPELQVEDAMALTLKDQGITMPATTLLAIGKTFKPAGIPRIHPPGT